MVCSENKAWFRSAKYLQGFNITIAMQEAETMFNKTHPNKQIWVTSFCKLRPIQVTKITETTRKTYLCQTCCHCSLMGEALQEFSRREGINTSASISKHWLMPHCVIMTRLIPERSASVAHVNHMVPQSYVNILRWSSLEMKTST